MTVMFRSQKAHRALTVTLIFYLLSVSLIQAEVVLCISPGGHTDLSILSMDDCHSMDYAVQGAKASKEQPTDWQRVFGGSTEFGHLEGAEHQHEKCIDLNLTFGFSSDACFLRSAYSWHHFIASMWHEYNYADGESLFSFLVKNYNDGYGLVRLAALVALVEIPISSLARCSDLFFSRSVFLGYQLRLQTQVFLF